MLARTSPGTPGPCEGGAGCDDRPAPRVIAGRGVLAEVRSDGAASATPGTQSGACGSGALRWSQPENVEEATTGLACLDDNLRVEERREILRAPEPPDVAVVHFEEEPARVAAQTAMKAQGHRRHGHGAG